MPNGFHSSLEEWQKMEAPYLRIDAILQDFAEARDLEIQKNYRGADRSLRWNNEISKAIWIGSMDEYGESETYQISVIAYQDRGTERYTKAGIVKNNAAISEIVQTLEKAYGIAESWSEGDLQLVKTGGEKLELL